MEKIDDLIDYKLLGYRIGERRRECKMTQETLAKEMELSSPHISNLEGGRAKPSFQVMVKLCQVLKCSMDYFIGNEYKEIYIEKEPEREQEKEMLAILKRMDPEKKEKLLTLLKDFDILI